MVPLWPALTQADSPLVRTLKGHEGSVLAVVLSRDAGTLVSGSWDRTIKVWDLTSGRAPRTLRGGAGGVASLALSANGRILASSRIRRFMFGNWMEGSYSKPYKAMLLMWNR